MLDKATIDRLARAPEKNAPTLNVALAEEGRGAVLLSLARSPAVGPEALSVIAERVAREGASVGHDPEVPLDEHAPLAGDLDRALIAHLNAPDAVRDAVLARHQGDPFFVLAAASHPRATLAAALRAVEWPAASPAHDRLWLALLDPGAIPKRTLEEWAEDASVLRREAAARIGRDARLLAILARDPARQVRRAVASNRLAAEERARLAAEDHAPDVRSRAHVPLTAHDAHDAHEENGAVVESARFAAALRAMAVGGVLAPDVVRALASAAELDDEGALLAGKVLPRRELGQLLDAIVDQGADGVGSPRGRSLAAGLALRPLLPWGDGSEEDEGDVSAEHTEIVYDAVKSLSRTTTAESRLTGKARLAAWAAEGLASSAHVDRDRVAADLARLPLGAERMILARGAAARAAMVGELCAAARSVSVVPGALLELAWADRSVPDAVVVELAARIAKPRKRAEDLPEDEIDLDPALRPLDVLEKVVLTAAVRANVSPRAGLAAVALDARRVRYVLSAMPQWKGRISGGKLARVLRQNAGALTVAHAEARARASRVESWTERMMTELEMAIALAVGHLTAAEIARRIGVGRQQVNDGIDLAFGAEARAALEGAASVQPILEWATRRRTAEGPALAVWLLLEKLDRERGSTLVAASVDTLAAGAKGVPASVCDALAIAEQRRPGRLEGIHPQSPRGRATVASAIARAYRALGGMRDERQG